MGYCFCKHDVNEIFNNSHEIFKHYTIEQIVWITEPSTVNCVTKQIVHLIQVR